MADTTENEELLEENAPSSYTTETKSEPTGSGQSVTAPGIGLGRRKSQSSAHPTRKIGLVAYLD